MPTPEEPNAQLDIYVGKDSLGQFRLYTSNDATVPLPSPVFTLYSGVFCQITFTVKSTLPNDNFDSQYLQWTTSQPASLVSDIFDSPSKQVTLVFNTYTGQELTHKFNLFMEGNPDPVQILCEYNGVPVDPTIVEKPGGAGY